MFLPFVVGKFAIPLCQHIRFFFPFTNVLQFRCKVLAHLAKRVFFTFKNRSKEQKERRKTI